MKHHDIVPASLWGRDHLSTLLYVETREVDYDGKLDNSHMRTNPRLHRKLLGKAQTMAGVPTRDFPTRLKDGFELENHDDWSCIEDMIAHKLLTIEETNGKPNDVFGGGVVRVALTDLGWEVAHFLRRRRRATGKTELTPELERKIVRNLPK